MEQKLSHTQAELIALRTLMQLLIGSLGAATSVRLSRLLERAIQAGSSDPELQQALEGLRGLVPPQTRKLPRRKPSR